MKLKLVTDIYENVMSNSNNTTIAHRTSIANIFLNESFSFSKFFLLDKIRNIFHNPISIHFNPCNVLDVRRIEDDFHGEIVVSKGV